MTNSFENLTTVRFQQRMKPAALRIYCRLFPGCEVEDLRENGVKVHVLDKEFGIDALIRFQAGQWVSVQEKYRAHKWLQYLDFTQEYMNAEGTEHESPGEWFKLGSQLYFYGWANEAETDFEKWVVLDVAAYKLLVERAGGLAAIGTKRQNRIHGRASFFAIPIQKLRPAFVYTHRDLGRA
jgi:hypothetical protein